MHPALQAAWRQRAAASARGRAGPVERPHRHSNPGEILEAWRQKREELAALVEAETAARADLLTEARLSWNTVRVVYAGEHETLYSWMVYGRPDSPYSHKLPKGRRRGWPFVFSLPPRYY